MFMMNLKISVEGGGPVSGPQWEKGGSGGSLERVERRAERRERKKRENLEFVRG